MFVRFAPDEIVPFIKFIICPLGASKLIIKSSTKLCVTLKVVIILSIVAPHGMPATESVLFTPVARASGIAIEIVPEVKDVLPEIFPPPAVNNSAGLLGQSTTGPAGVIVTVVGVGLTVAFVVAGSDIHPSLALVAMKVYVP